MRLERVYMWMIVLCTPLLGVLSVTAAEPEQDRDKDGAGKVLSRQRRYLTFPEGSSLQVVFDQTIPIVGLPLMYTIGVTVAIAYELPSKPWYHYLKDIRKNLHNSAYLLRKDQNVSQLTYTDQGKKPDLASSLVAAFASGTGLPAKANLLNVAPIYNSNLVDYNKQHPYYYKDTAGVNPNPLNGDKSWNGNTPVSYYSKPNPLAPPLPPQWSSAQATSATKLQPVSNKLGYYFGKDPNQLGASVGNQLSQWMKYLPMKLNSKQPIYWSDVVKGISQLATKRKDYVTAVNQLPQILPMRYGWKKGHKKPILPVFGKRSVDSHGTPEVNEVEEKDQVLPDSDDEFEAQLEKLIAQEEQKHFVRHHRQTRHDLYAKIESSLNSKGLNGRECVLRTLCEAGHKQVAPNLPNTFAAEIIKTVFSLPKLTDDEHLTTDKAHLAYDLAHQSNEDCTELYPDCEGDLWNHPLLY